MPSNSSSQFEHATRVAPRSAVLSWQYRLVSVLVRGCATVWPGKAVQWLATLWFKPFSSAPRPHVRAWLATADQQYALSTVPVYVWGNTGPLVVAVHGWRGSGWQFRRFVQPLVSAGFRVAVFDGPAHGNDVRRETHLYEFIDVLNDIHHSIAPIDRMIGHSLGCAAIGLAERCNIPVKKAAFLAGNFDIEFLLVRFCEHLQLSESFRNKLRDAIRDYCDRIIFSGAYQTINAGVIGECLSTAEVAFWQDESDNEIHLGYIHQLHRSLSSSQMHQTPDVGHFNILKDPAVVNAVCDFMRR